MPATTATSGEANPFLKQLASSNRKTRDQALESLRTYLQRPAAFDELDFLKLWKGLFFCMWMSDKPLTQQRLARDLADLVHVVKSKENFLGFVQAFWLTMAREWGGIDALRMDKFLYLVRCYLNRGFERVSRQGWSDDALCDQYLHILELVPLNTDDPKVPHGLRFHVIDIYVDELDKVDTKRDVPLEKVISPMEKLSKSSLSKAVRQRAQAALEDERLHDWRNVHQELDQSDDGDVVGDGHQEHQRQARGSAAGEEDEFGGFDD